MPVKSLKFYTRNLVQGNPDAVFVFGDNVERKGRGGQAKACRDMPNVIGIRTKYRPASDEAAFFTGTQAEYEMIAEDLDRVEQALREGKTVFLPRGGIGTGRAQLYERAPYLYAWMRHRLSGLIHEHGKAPKP